MSKKSWKERREVDLEFKRQQFMIVCRSYFPNCIFRYRELYYGLGVSMLNTTYKTLVVEAEICFNEYSNGSYCVEAYATDKTERNIDFRKHIDNDINEVTEELKRLLGLCKELENEN